MGGGVGWGGIIASLASVHIQHHHLDATLCGGWGGKGGGWGGWGGVG